MFSISSKGSYGLSAVYGFGLNFRNGPVQIRTIAEEYEIPQNYLEQLLIKLKNGGIMKSFRGASGGYMLARDPSEITVYDVLVCVEGDQDIVNDPGNTLVLKKFWKDAQKNVKEVFSVTIEELIMEQKRLEKNITFQI